MTTNPKHRKPTNVSGRLGSGAQPRSPAAAARKLKPFSQGDLDGLCGIYSVVNAIRLLCPETRKEQSGELFSALIARLRKEGRPPNEFVSRGIEATELWRLVRTAQRFMKGEFGVRIAAQPLKLHRHRRRYEEMWLTLKAVLNDQAVAIIGLSGLHGHWTVAYRASDKAAHLFDSDNLKLLFRSRCSLDDRKTMHWIGPEDVVFLQRIDAPLRPPLGRRRRVVGGR